MSNVQVNDTRAGKLRAYLMDIINGLNNQYKQINFNFLDSDVDNYSLDKIPTNPDTIEGGWIIGNIEKSEIYSFRSRKNYSADVITNIGNLGFYETFEKIIEQTNYNGDLPDIEGIQSIRCTNCGTQTNATTNTAEFDIQIMIVYLSFDNDILPSL